MIFTSEPFAKITCAMSAINKAKIHGNYVACLVSKSGKQYDFPLEFHRNSVEVFTCNGKSQPIILWNQNTFFSGINFFIDKGHKELLPLNAFINIIPISKQYENQVSATTKDFAKRANVTN